MTVRSATPTSGSIIGRGTRLTIVWEYTSTLVLPTLTYIPGNGAPNEVVFTQGVTSGYQTGFSGSFAFDSGAQTYTFEFVRDAGWENDTFQIGITETVSGVSEAEYLNYTILGEGQYPPHMVPFTEPAEGGQQVLVYDSGILRGAAIGLDFDVNLDVADLGGGVFKIDAIGGGAGGSTVDVQDRPSAGGTPTLTGTAAILSFGTNLTVTRPDPVGDPGRYHIDADTGSLTFLGLSDVVPSTYAGQSGRLAAVNVTENGMVFIDPPPGTFLGLTDVDETTYSGKAEYVARVNQAGTAMELVAPAVAEGGQEVVGGVASTGSGGFTIALGSTGIAGVQFPGLNALQIDFDSPFADSNYFIQATPSADPNHTVSIANKSPSSCTLFVSSGGSTVDPETVVVALDIVAQDDPAGASGSVSGPGSSTDNALVRWDQATGNLIKDSSAILSDIGNLSLVGSLTTANGVVSANQLIAGGGGITSNVGSSSIADLTVTGIPARFTQGVQMQEQAHPATPGTGLGMFYVWNNNNTGPNRPYFKDEAGNEFDLAAAATAAGTVNVVVDITGNTVNNPTQLQFTGRTASGSRVVDNAGDALVTIHDLQVSDGTNTADPVGAIQFPAGTVTALAGTPETAIIGGLVLTDGTSLMSAGYVPTNDRHVATKKYVDDAAPAGGGGTGGVAGFALQGSSGAQTTTGGFTTNAATGSGVTQIRFNNADVEGVSVGNTMSQTPAAGDVLWLRSRTTQQFFSATISSVTTSGPDTVVTLQAGPLNGSSADFSGSDTWDVGFLESSAGGGGATTFLELTDTPGLGTYPANIQRQVWVDPTGSNLAYGPRLSIVASAPSSPVDGDVWIQTA